MSPEFYSPLERKIYRLLAEYGEGGGTIFEIRQRLKSDVQAGTVRNSLLSMKKRGLVVQNQFTRDRSRMNSGAENADVYEVRQ